VHVAAQFRELESRLPSDWSDARLVFTLDDAGSAERAASLLGSFAPGRVGGQLRFSAPRRGGRLDQMRRVLASIDREGIGGKLELVTSSQAAPTVERPRIAWSPAAEGWDSALAALPEDWSDLYVQIELASSDFLDRAALLMAPLNPARHGDAVEFRFRVARLAGYGTSPAMTRRCLERLDENGIRARIEILRALSDTRSVATQGPVWYVEGKAV